PKTKTCRSVLPVAARSSVEEKASTYPHERVVGWVTGVPCVTSAAPGVTRWSACAGTAARVDSTRAGSPRRDLAWGMPGPAARRRPRSAPGFRGLAAARHRAVAHGSCVSMQQHGLVGEGAEHVRLVAHVRVGLPGPRRRLVDEPGLAGGDHVLADDRTG